jgi:hypothetical protein
MDVKDAWHPCIAKLNVNFIPNDICLGNPNCMFDEEEKEDRTELIMLLTGPSKNFIIYTLIKFNH